MVPDNLLNTSSNTASPLFPNTALADLGISSDLSQLNALLSKSIGSPSSLNSERTASQTINLQNDDSLITGDSSGILFAGTGKDIINASETATTIFASEGNKSITGSPGDDTIYAQAGNDIINASQGNNRVFAGKGNNRVITGSGNDFVTAGLGDDQIYTGAGDDNINAGDGNNLIKPGTGNDAVSVGNGNDQIILEAGEGSVTISGFNAIADKLRLGGSLVGKSISLVTELGSTLVKAGDDLLATIKDVVTGVQKALISADIPLYRYQAIDLGAIAPTGNATQANAINDKGQIVGRSQTTEVSGTGFRNQGFIWDNGAFKPLTSTGIKNGGGENTGKEVTQRGGGGFTAAINDLGAIAGTSDEFAGRATDRGLLWQKGADGEYELQITDLPGVETYFFDINNQNQMAGRHIYGPGSTATAPNRSRPLSVDQGFINPLPDLGGDTGTANGINNQGVIVGQIDNDGLNDKTVNTAALWEKGADGKYKLTNLGTFGAEQAIARDINDAGQVIGWTAGGTGATATSSPFLWQDGQKINLGSFGGATGQTAGINQFGQVVGYSQNSVRQDRAFVWNNGTIKDLNSLVTANPSFNGSQVTLTRASGINNFGDISAYGTYTYTDAKGATQTGTRAYLLKAFATT
jgi:probable HAF family extracellular repeat protein